MTKTQINKPAWLKISEEELKKIIIELSEKYQPAQLGLVLRDQYGVPTTKVYGKKLSKILKELGLPETTELKNVEKKVETLKDHLKANKQDKKAKHKMQKAQSRVMKLKKYFAKK